MSASRLIPVLIALLIAGASSALAHSQLLSATPPSGSIVPAAPEFLELEFGETVRLTSVVLEAPKAGRQKLKFSPSKKASKFSIETRDLPAGRHEIVWKALSADGHPVSGSVILVVRPEE